MIPAFSRPWLFLAVGLAWFFLLLWPLLGIHADGTLTFDKSFQVWIRVAVAAAIFVGLRQLNKAGAFNYITRPLAMVRESGQSAASLIPKPVWILLALAVALAYPQFTGRYAQDVAVSVLVYVCLGLGLNVV
ncbi:MAG: branched-chain amino acid ABC transporter permease, partial [Desulfocurvibacter africanus]